MPPWPRSRPDSLMPGGRVDAGDTVGAQATLPDAGGAPFAFVPNADRPYVKTVAILALPRRITQARQVVALLEREQQTTRRWLDDRLRPRCWRDRCAEGRYADAVREYQDGDVFSPCLVCMQPRLARAFDLADNVIRQWLCSTVGRDSRCVPATGPSSSVSMRTSSARAHERLGELHEARGDVDRARRSYRGVDLAHRRSWVPAPGGRRPPTTGAADRGYFAVAATAAMTLAVLFAAAGMYRSCVV